MTSFKAYISKPIAFVDSLYLSIVGVRRPVHPYDRSLGIETSERVNGRLIKTGDKFLDDASIGYLGSTPSVVRKSLEAIGVEKEMIFVDLGCGKGRALAVAAEYPFEALVGYELSEYVCGVARRNMSKLPGGLRSKRITILQADASRPKLPDAATIVLFLYHSFRRPLVERLLIQLRSELSVNSRRKIWLIYYNPVYFDIFDDSKDFTRFFAEKIEFEKDEAIAAPFGDTHDNVIIYQSIGPDQRQPIPGADRKARVRIPDLAAEVLYE